MCAAALFVFFSVVAIGFGSASGQDKGQALIAVLPFTINAEKDLSFLREGIMDMLMTRLYWKDKVRVVEKEKVKAAVKDVSGPMDSAKAGEVGKRLGADYALFGSITIFGDSVSIDATMSALTKPDPPVTVFVQTKGMESVIPEINNFAQKVNNTVFGRPSFEQEAARTAQARPQGAGPNPTFTVYDSEPDRASFWRSRSFNKEIIGLDLGDVNGDKLNELVLIEETAISVYSFKEGSLSKLATYEAEDKNRFVWVDVADINGNGRAEIFASKASASSVSSVVLEMEGARLKPIVKDSEWFYRVMDWPGSGRILIGQQRMAGTHTGDVNLYDSFFMRGIYRLRWNGRDYDREGGPLLQHKGIHVFNFSVGTLGKERMRVIACIDWYEKLKLLTMEGQEFYKSSDYFGGTLNYIRTGEDVRADSLKRDMFYVPARILMTDVDKDGTNEIVINQNRSTTLGMTERLRAFADGKIVGLSWDGVSLNTIWESRKLTGCISSFQIGDFDNDGTDDLVVGLVQERGVSLLAKARSAVVSYRIEPKKENVK